jgi:CHAD domain-containing protein
LIRKRHKRLLRDSENFARLAAPERHRLRIDVKRLRYSVDALASLFPEKPVDRYIDILVALQDALGQANDAVTAARLLPQLDPPADFATFARGWFGAKALGDRTMFEALLESLAATPRFWRN